MMADMDVMTIAAITSVVTGIIAGGLSSLGTVAALRVHITYLRETLTKHDRRLTKIEDNQRTLRADAPVDRL